MKALQYRTIGAAPEVVTVPDPEPGPGQVLLKVTAAGVCHSDIAVMSWPAEGFPYDLPLTLGHEGVGTVAALGAGVTGVREGDAVAVYGPWGCGTCAKCAQGKENYCLRADALGIRPPGLGRPGAIAEYLLVDDPRHLVPLDALDPVAAAPLTDAGLTPYHAIRRSLPKLVPGSTAVVIGVGGLGHMAVQVLAAMAGGRVVRVDQRDDALELARTHGAEVTVAAGADAAAAIRDATAGVGADVVLDFVGADATMQLGVQVARPLGDLTVVGIAGGSLPFGFFTTPYEVSLQTTYWGSIVELMELRELARRGVVEAECTTYPLADAASAYAALRSGQLRGRAVVVP